MQAIKPADAFSKYQPKNITFVISVDKKNKPNGMVAAWHTILSKDPDLMGVAIYKKQNTHKLIQESKEFVLAIPSKKLLKAIDIFGGMHGNEVDKFEISKIKITKAKILKVPLLTDATINFECKLIKQVPVGDHTFFIGKVVAAHIQKGQKILLSNGYNKKGERKFCEI